MKQPKYVLSMMLTVAGACGSSEHCENAGLGDNLCEADGGAHSDTGIDASADDSSAGDSSGGDDAMPKQTSADDGTTGGGATLEGGGTHEGGSVVVDGTSDGSDDASDEGESSSDDGTVVPTPWCADEDGDGFGDPADCSAVQGPTDVDNNDDCDDTNALVFPGSAELEVDLTLCTADLDQDGYADASPPLGVSPGTDCWDSNADLNPAKVIPASIDSTLLDDLLVRVDLQTGNLSLVGIFDTLLLPWHVTSSTINVDGTIYVNDSFGDRIYTITHELLCLGELSLIDVDPLPESHGLDEVCGITFMGDGRMFAVDADTDTLVQLDPATGEVLTSLALEYEENGPLDIDGCGMAWDCAEDRMLLANGLDGNVYEVDVGSANATLLADTGLSSTFAGLEYDVTTGKVWMAAAQHLWSVAIDGTAEIEDMSAFDYGLLGNEIVVDDLGSIPVCNP